MCIELEILKNRAKLERMILENEGYEKILEQSKKLDDYINTVSYTHLTIPTNSRV